ncbi:hypothetical protein Zm00014a_002084 [Zea mays]|uniref:Uncharacterized protein n=1 Tax=Zea mays TaxID=4577 RepID=A0A3L6FGX7_MAIZE|nr:hypothetical protein Zm00014a_002084 [Zea mays]
MYTIEALTNMYLVALFMMYPYPNTQILTTSFSPQQPNQTPRF